MARSHNWTNPQREIGRTLSAGLTIKRYGNRGTHSGYAVFDVTGRWMASASKAALKTLAGYELVAQAENGRIYFTTKGYWSWFGGAPGGEAARLCALADAHVQTIKALMSPDGESAA